MAKKPKKIEESGLPEPIKNTIDTLASKGQKALQIAQTLDLPIEEVKKHLAARSSNAPKAGSLMARNKKGATIMTPAASARGDDSRVELFEDRYEGKIHKIKED